MNEKRPARRRPKPERARGRQKKVAPTGPDRQLALGTPQLLLLLGGVVVAIAGFWVLSTGSINLAPTLLVVAYLILIPVALALPRKQKGAGSESSDS